MRDLSIYLDQNVLGLAAEGSVRLSSPAEAIWVYSEEHFNEMTRGEPSRFLKVLDKLEARQIKHESGDNFKIEPYSCVRERYERHIQAINEAPFDETPHFELLARVFGADNFDQVSELPEILISQVDDITRPYGIALASKNAEVREVAAKLKTQIDTKLDQVRPLKESRKALGDSRNRIGDVKADNPIPAIWEIIKLQIPGITMDHFFGKKPIPAINQLEHSLFSGIIWCHMMLNFLGYNKDKGTHKAEKWANILSDGRHTAYGAGCDILLSADAKFCTKASAIYKYFGVNAKVAHLAIQ